MNQLLSLAFILSLHQPYHGGGAINTPTHTLYVLAASGWYTPEARRALFATPIIEADTGGALARFDGTSIAFRTGYWNGPTFYPEYARLTMMHEFNHVFDNQHHFSQSPEFQARSLGLDFPAANPDFKLDDYTPVERYAYIGMRPWLFPELREFYPQFTDKAFTLSNQYANR